MNFTTIAQFRVRTMLGLVTAFCLVLGWVANASSRRQSVLAHVRSCGGAVITQVRGPMWLRGITPSHWLEEPVFIDLSGERFGHAADEGLCREFQSWADLGGVDHELFASTVFRNLYSPKRVDMDMSLLSKCDVTLLGSSVYLDMHNTGAVDDDVTPFLRLSALMVLDLNRTKVTDQVVPLLSGLKNLRRLDICETGISEEGCAELRRHLPSTMISHYRVIGNRAVPCATCERFEKIQH